MDVVILAGGVGARLWPLSREKHPKQHLCLEEGRNSLLRETLDRAAALAAPERILVVTHRDQAAGLRLELEEAGFPDMTLLIEPRACNTAPAVGLAAWWLQRRGAGKAVLLVLPADHYIPSRNDFVALMQKGRRSGERYGLVTFGLRPTRPETGFGYIRSGTQLDDSTFQVERFIEKPPLEQAQQYLADPRYLWNSGMFVFRVSTLIDHYRRHLPALAASLDRIDYRRRCNLEEIYSTIEPISIDHGILERAGGAVAVVPADLVWSDVGSWESLFTVLEKDADGNYLRGRVIASDTRDSLILARSRLVAAAGLRDSVVVETADAVLVCPRSAAQEVREIVKILKAEGASECEAHRTVNRPWGSYTVLELAEKHQVKRITVRPGCRLSLQSHRRRSEQWVVVRGEALVTVDEREMRLTRGASVSIPVGVKHRLENTGQGVLELIEVQTGDYLGEDDIIRYADDYGREGP